MPKEKKSATSAISPARSAARGVSTMVPMVTSRPPAAMTSRVAAFRRAEAARPPFVAVLPSRSALWATVDSTAASTHERARAISSRDTVRGIMISTTGWPPASTRSRAASINARTCMA